MFLVRIGANKWLTVEEIHKRWETTECCYVQVTTEDNRVCILRYDPPTDKWTVCLAPVRAGDNTPQRKLDPAEGKHIHMHLPPVKKRKETPNAHPHKAEEPIQDAPVGSADWTAKMRHELEALRAKRREGYTTERDVSHTT